MSDNTDIADREYEALVRRAKLLEEILEDLLEWEEWMGGFESAHWERARRAMGHRV